jgi:hypothetical protein
LSLCPFRPHSKIAELSFIFFYMQYVTEKSQITEKVEEYRAKINELKNSISYEKNIQSAANNAASGTNALRVLFFLFTFFTISVVSNFKNLWREGIGKLALAYFVCLFGFIIWIGLLIS